MTHRFTLFLVAFVTFGLFDTVWLGAMSSAFRKRKRSLLARMSGDRLAPLWAPALVVYALLAIGIVVFVIPPIGMDPSMARGALFGFVVYGAYDLANLSTTRFSTAVLVLIDILWGAAMSAVTTWIVATVHRLLH
jgi:uncharacterized membrane protein